VPNLFQGAKSSKPFRELQAPALDTKAGGYVSDHEHRMGTSLRFNQDVLDRSARLYSMPIVLSHQRLFKALANDVLEKLHDIVSEELCRLGTIKAMV
jgi:hypothetical protein